MASSSVEKTYAEALFTLITDEKGEKSAEHTAVLNELASVSQIIAGVPEFAKILSTPTVAKDEKVKLLETVFGGGKISAYTFNFLKVAAVKGRFRYFDRILRQYLSFYNEAFGITDITVITAMSLDEGTRQKIKAKMESITGKTVRLTEKLDRTLIGGLIIDYGTERLDGSVKTRLESMRQDIAGIVA